MIVSITSSEFVRKGPKLPVFSDEERAEQISSLRFVDEVYICKAPYAEPALRKFTPDYYVKGIDYIGEEMIAKDLATCKELGIGVIFTATRKYSSGALCKRLHK